MDRGGKVRRRTRRTLLSSRLRESEDRYRIAIESSNDGAAIVRGGTHLYVNRRFVEMFGYAAQDEITGRPLSAIVHPDDYDRVITINDLRQRGEQASTRYGFKGVKKGGEPVFVEVSAACILYRGKPASLAYFRDVTERNTAEAQVKASLAEKEVLLKEIHHRVKNNLQIISSLLYLQSRAVDDAKTIEALNESQNRIKSMALVHDALYRSLDVAHIDMTEYVSSLVRHLANSYRREDILVNVKVDVAHVSFPIDMAVPCGLIVNELISNALKHAFKTSGDNRVRVALVSGEGKFVLSVTDNGVGLSAELDVTKSPSLGLQLVCVLVDQLDGTMEVSGDEGTAFTITFG